jgi:hypothetical protein
MDFRHESDIGTEAERYPVGGLNGIMPPQLTEKRKKFEKDDDDD